MSVNADHMKKKTWLETHHVYATDRSRVPNHWDVVYEVKQPRRDWLIGQVVQFLDRLTWRWKPVRWVTRQIERQADKLDHLRHVARSGCKGDCGTWYRRLPSDPATGHFETDEAHAIKGCVHTPLSVRWDLWVYDVVHRRREEYPRSSEDRATDS